jgi:hypothetical protein
VHDSWLGGPSPPAQRVLCHEHADARSHAVSVLPAQVTEAGTDASSGLQGKVTYSRLGCYSKTDPFNSLYLGSFGPHGPELLQLSRWVGQPAGCLPLPFASAVPTGESVVAWSTAQQPDARQKLTSACTIPSSATAMALSSPG